MGTCRVVVYCSIMLMGLCLLYASVTSIGLNKTNEIVLTVRVSIYFMVEENPV